MLLNFFLFSFQHLFLLYLHVYHIIFFLFPKCGDPVDQSHHGERNPTKSPCGDICLPISLRAHTENKADNRWRKCYNRKTRRRNAPARKWSSDIGNPVFFSTHHALLSKMKTPERKEDVALPQHPLLPAFPADLKCNLAFALEQNAPTHDGHDSDYQTGHKNHNSHRNATRTGTLHCLIYFLHMQLPYSSAPYCS